MLIEWMTAVALTLNATAALIDALRRLLSARREEEGRAQEAVDG